MFCPSCGTEYTIELKYCNRCGANLSGVLAPQAERVIINLTKPALIISGAMVFLTLGGFAGLIRGALRLAPVIQGHDPIIAMIFMGMLTILIVDIFLVRQLSKLISTSLQLSAQPQQKRTKDFANAGMSQLQQPTPARLQAAPSVTEHTTRFFEPYRAPSNVEDRPPAERLKREL